jgi:branched-chain amino acid transport system ATP-binding protein
MAGAVRARSGTIEFGGRGIGDLPPESIARLGLATVPERRRVFSSLTVEENLRLGLWAQSGHRGGEHDLHQVLDYFPKLAERRRSLAARLSGGEQQMLVIARALLSRPRLIALDEPSFGLAPMVVDQVYDILQDWRARRNLTLLIVEQTATRALSFSDRVYVLRSGQIEHTGSPAEICDSERLEQAYFGFPSTAPQGRS